MAYIDPKTDWSEAYQPSTNDMNRIEGDIEYIHDTQVPAEESARISADNTLQNNIDSEASIRASADNTLQDNIDSEESARISADNSLSNRIDSNDSDISTLDGRIDSNDSDISTLDYDKAGLGEDNIFLGDNTFTGNNTFDNGVDLGNCGFRLKTKIFVGDLDSLGRAIFAHGISTSKLSGVSVVCYWESVNTWYTPGSSQSVHCRVTSSEIKVYADDVFDGYRVILWYID